MPVLLPWYLQICTLNNNIVSWEFNATSYWFNCWIIANVEPAIVGAVGDNQCHQAHSPTEAILIVTSQLSIMVLKDWNMIANFKSVCWFVDYQTLVSVCGLPNTCLSLSITKHLWGASYATQCSAMKWEVNPRKASPVVRRHRSNHIDIESTWDAKEVDDWQRKHCRDLAESAGTAVDAAAVATVATLATLEDGKALEQMLELKQYWRSAIAVAVLEVSNRSRHELFQRQR